MSRIDRDAEKNERIAELEAAIERIVAAWDGGDLAGAVNDAAGLLEEG